MINVCIIDKNGIYQSAREIGEFDTWGDNELFGVHPPVGGGIQKWNGNQWEVLSEYPRDVPQTITPLQAKLKLLDMGLLDEVEAMVATDRKIQLYWSEALEIKRDHATLLAMATALGLSDAQLDEMFIEASKLS